MISVIIPHLNQGAQLRRCLEALTRQADEIIVVDNGSETPPNQICAEFANVALLNQCLKGPGPARNLGAAHAQGDILAFIDADCVAAPNWIEQIRNQFASDEAPSILGGKVCVLCSNPDMPTASEAYECVYGYQMDIYISRHSFTGTGNLAVRRDVWRAVGEFSGHDVAEDRDWGQRATAAGYGIQYVPTMCVTHPARATSADLFTKVRRHVAHDYISSSRTNGQKGRYALKALLVGLSPIAECPRLFASAKLQSASLRLKVLAVMTWIRLYRMALMLELLATNNPSRILDEWNRPNH